MMDIVLRMPRSINFDILITSALALPDLLCYNTRLLHSEKCPGLWLRTACDNQWRGVNAVAIKRPLIITPPRFRLRWQVTIIP